MQLTSPLMFAAFLFFLFFFFFFGYVHFLQVQKITCRSCPENLCNFMCTKVIYQTMLSAFPVIFCELQNTISLCNGHIKKGRCCGPMQESNLGWQHFPFHSYSTLRVVTLGQEMCYWQDFQAKVNFFFKKVNEWSHHIYQQVFCSIVYFCFCVQICFISVFSLCPYQ